MRTSKSRKSIKKDTDYFGESMSKSKSKKKNVFIFSKRQ